MTLHRLICAALMALGLGLAAAAQPVEAPPPASAPAPPPVAAPASAGLDRVALAAFVDGAVAQARLSERIAGVAVCVTERGAAQPALLAGYGWADVAAGRPVDPAATRFRIASISKTFTWLLLNRLIDEGRVGLDDPVNQHLPIRLHVPEDGFPEPVLVRHLLTHTAGFEDSAVGHLFVNDPARVTPLASYLAEHRPRRVRAPGQVTSYSNYATALAGALVAHVAGSPFEDYAEQTLLRRLLMNDTSFREPYPADLVAEKGLPTPLSPLAAAAFSQGYVWSAGRYDPRPMELMSQIAPAASVSTTAADMCRYLQALSAPDGLARAGAVSARVQDSLSRNLFTNNPAVAGVNQGFMEYLLPGGRRGFGHGGATQFFHSNLVVVPELGLGVFVTTNTASGASFARRLPDLIIERFYPAAPPPPPIVREDWAGYAKGFAGTYLTNRRAYTTAEKVTAALFGVMTVAVGPEGELITTIGSSSRRWVEVAPNQFRAVEGPDTLAFDRAEGAAATRVLHGSGVVAFDRIPPWQAPGALFLALGACAFLGAVGLVAGACRFGRDLPGSWPQRWAGRIVTLAGAGWVATLVLLGVVLQQFAGPLGEERALMGWPTPVLTAFLWTATFTAGASALALLTAPLALLPGGWPWHRRVRHGVGALAFGLGAVTLWLWNLVGHAA